MIVEVEFRFAPNFIENKKGHQSLQRACLSDPLYSKINLYETVAKKPFNQMSALKIVCPVVHTIQQLFPNTNVLAISYFVDSYHLAK